MKHLFPKPAQFANVAWATVLAVGFMAVALTSIASLSLARLAPELQRERTDARSLVESHWHGDVRTQSNLTPAARDSSLDFAQQLPPLDLQSILSTVQRSASEAGVVFAGVQIQDRRASQELLARADLSVSLRGAYPKLIQVLSDVLSRYPNATLARASLRRQGPPDQIDATVVIALWGASLLPEQPVTKPASTDGAVSTPAAGTGH